MDREKIMQFYSLGLEKDRLDSDPFYLEGIRTKEIISRYLPQASMKIIDIGGGTGNYAFWLQALGHHVSLLDLSPENINLANSFSEKSGIKLSACEQGEASALKFKDNQFDLALLLGPLYHLPDKSERLKALSEVKRVLKPGGILLAATISRYASLLDGFKRDLVNDDDFYDLLRDDLKTGIHLNKTENPDYFTTAYFHTAAGIKEEIIASGLEFIQNIAIESFGWFIDNLKQKTTDNIYKNKLLTLINWVESNEDFVAISPHIMTIARKK
jgi:ubiquinone/menaquinone biosynthesis C-methylase UbiE